MKKKYVLRIQCGTRRKGNSPRYVSSAEIVGDDIVIHTSDVPVYIADDLAHSAGTVLLACSNRARYCEFSVEEVTRDCDSFVGLPNHTKYSFALAEAFRQFIDLYGYDAWNDLVNDAVLPRQEVSE